MDYLLDWRDFQGVNGERFFKTTLWQGTNVMLGLNCLEAGQTQSVHKHDSADKFYFVLSGSGVFSVGTATYNAGAGMLVTAPAGIPHGVRNDGGERLCLLVGIAPPLK